MDDDYKNYHYAIERGNGVLAEGETVLSAVQLVIEELELDNSYTEMVNDLRAYQKHGNFEILTYEEALEEGHITESGEWNDFISND